MAGRGRTNPKRSAGRDERPRTNWYRYYAGYSSEFVAKTIDSLHLPVGATVLDPWNGSGTTTQLARDKGFATIGFDINPAMVIVAKARLLRTDAKESIASLCIEIVDKAASPAKRPTLTDEPLLRWFAPSTATALRMLERAIEKLLVSNPIEARLVLCSTFDHISSLAAFFYTALFRATRRSLRKFQTSNPTWIKTPSSSRDRVRLPDFVVFDAFKSSCLEMIADMHDERSDQHELRCRVDLASSTLMPLTANDVQAVISSPPYCTRIDYAVATWPELAIMGASATTVDALRRRTLGTTTVQGDLAGERSSWGRHCARTLRRVSKHPSKASNTYYRRNLTQYFDGMDRSMGEIARVLCRGGQAVLVVQDSYYKDVHIDLPRIVEEMAFARGLVHEHRQNFRIARTLAAINNRVVRYRSAASAVEAVLCFSKE